MTSGVCTIKCLFGTEGGQTRNEAFTDFSFYTLTILMDMTWYSRYLVSALELQVLP